MPLQTTLNVALNAILAEVVDLGSRQADIAKRISKAFADGSGADQANKIYQDTNTLAGAAAQSLDLDAGTILGPFGVAVPALTQVRAILIEADPTNPDNVTVGGDFVTAVLMGGIAADPATIKVRPGGAVLLMAPGAVGYAPVAGTGDVITMTNAHATVAATFSILIIGS